MTDCYETTAPVKTMKSRTKNGTGGKKKRGDDKIEKKSTKSTERSSDDLKKELLKGETICVLYHFLSTYTRLAI